MSIYLVNIGEESMNALANKIMDKKVKVDILDIDNTGEWLG